MKRTLLSVMMMLGLIVTPAIATAAQPTSLDTSFLSEFSDVEVDLGTSGDVQFIDDNYSSNEYSSGWEEFIWFTTGWSNFEMILVGGDNTADYYTEVTIENMNEFYDTFEIVDTEVSGTEGSFVANATISGDPLVVYYEFEVDVYGDTDLGMIQFAPADSLADDFSVVQDEVTVNGEPFMPDVDAEEVAALVNEDGGATPEGDDDVVATPTDEDGAEDTGVTRTQRGNTTEGTEDTGDTGDTDEPVDADRPGLEGLNGLGTDSDETGTAEATATDPESTGDLEALGLISETEWESPGFGTSITWDGGTWTIPTDYEYAIVLNEDPVYEVVTLETTDGLGYVFVTVEDQGERTPLTEANYWNSADFTDGFEADVSVVEVTSTQNTASVIYETVNTQDQDLYVVMTATFLDDGTVMYTQISAAPDTIHEVYGQFVDGIEVNGAPLDLTYTVDDIIEISGN